MATVPDRFVRIADIDFAEEVLSIMQCSTVTHSNNIKPFTLGMMSILESMGNKFISGDPDCTWFDYAVIFYVNEKGKRCLSDVSKYIRDNEKPLIRKVRLFMLMKLLKGKPLNFLSAKKLKDIIELSFSGYNMIPQCGAASNMSNPYVFGAETIAHIQYVCGDKLNKTPEEILWEVPLVLIGHLMSMSAIENGVKGVERKGDHEHVKAILAKCKQWDKEERLYPWQWWQPDVYPLEHYQTSEKIKQAHKKRLSEVLKCQN